MTPVLPASAPTPLRRLDRLDAAIAVTRTPVDQAVLRAERAALLVRLGRDDEAARLRADLHAAFDARPDPRVSAALGLAEAAADLRRGDERAARDRLRRVHALAVATRLRGPATLAAAMLAERAAVAGDAPALERHLREAWDASTDEADPEARARVARLVARVLHRGGDAAAAAPWYARARGAAARLGDGVLQAELMHAIAWAHGTAARAAGLGCAPWNGSDDATAAGAAADAARTAAGDLDRLVGRQGHGSGLVLLEAMRAADDGGAVAALAGLDAASDRLEADGLGRWRAWLEAERAWCRQQAGGDTGAATAAALAALDRLDDPLDRALALARLAQVAAARGDAVLARSRRSEADVQVDAQRARQAALAAAIAPVCGTGGLARG